ncbi:FimD/PapC N-terminal domain-containing protein [Shewanella chilikensis]|uniref:PapC N-terminal domain-containing protein n=1 Tax=Shewanella chilikensis TaxID=558541 RepID=A0A6G7LM75_9GAMM|nr:hypothetical protein GII14_00640 [Shewanella chilikensis]
MKKLSISNFITLLVVSYTLSFGCRITLAETSTSVGASSTSVTFDSSLLNMVGSDSFDLSYFQDGASALPGNYKSAVYINKMPEFNCEVRHSPISSSQCHFFKDNRWLLEV